MKWPLRALATILLLIVAMMSLARRQNSGWITFYSYRDGDAAVYIMTGDGGAVRNITPDGVCATSPQWSPDGKWIAYIDECGSLDVVHGIQPAGARPSVLAQIPDGVANFRWSPDGERMAIGAWSSAVIEVDVGTHDASYLAYDHYAPQWSADGQWIYAVPNLNEISGLDRINVVSEDIEHLLPPYAGVTSHLSWSPDGETIAIALGNMEKIDNALVLMNPDGSDIRLVAEAVAPAQPYDPVWSPDGEWIAFSFRAPTGWMLHRVRPDGSQLEAISPVMEGILHVQWTADGDWLVFAGQVDGIIDIYRVRPDGSALENLTEGNGFNYAPHLAPVAGREWHPLLLLVVALGILAAAVGLGRPEKIP